MTDRESLTDHALEFLRVDDLLHRDPPVGRYTDPEQLAEWRATLRRQREELMDKMRQAAGLAD